MTGIQLQDPFVYSRGLGQTSALMGRKARLEESVQT